MGILALATYMIIYICFPFHDFSVRLIVGHQGLKVVDGSGGKESERDGCYLIAVCRKLNRLTFLVSCLLSVSIMTLYM